MTWTVGWPSTYLSMLIRAADGAAMHGRKNKIWCQQAKPQQPYVTCARWTHT